MKAKDVNRLIDKYLEGKTSPDEERRLAWGVNRPDAPAEWQVIREMLGELTLSEAVYENTLARRRRRNVSLWMGWRLRLVLPVWRCRVTLNSRSSNERRRLMLPWHRTPLWA